MKVTGMPFLDDRKEAALVLADGTVFLGEAIGIIGTRPGTIATGELVFNTSLSGYQEIITDPSYAGQVIAFTFPHIGNYGVTEEDNESLHPFCRGVIVRELATIPSNWRAAGDLEGFLVQHGIGGLTGVDTRRLTRHIREAGAMSCALGVAPIEELLTAARNEPGTVGMDLVREVTTPDTYVIEGGPRKVVAYDFGIKRSILRYLSPFATIEVVPATTPAAEVLAKHPDGVFLSNGPGDPAALTHIVSEIAGLFDSVPIFGICLGHQLLASALGATTYKLPFGHHGGNHPVMRLSNQVVEVTAQNHGYAVREESLRDAVVTHRNLNDGVVEGIASTQLAAFSVQYHPEAAPGPHDAQYLFEEFARMMDRTTSSMRGA